MNKTASIATSCTKSIQHELGSKQFLLNYKIGNELESTINQNQTISRIRWEDIRNRRKFFETFAKSHGIINPKHWGNISVRQIQKAKGWGLLKRYEGSLVKALQASFPEISWNKNWFQQLKYTGLWEDKENRKQFFLKFAKNHDIKKPSDWGKITLREIKEKSGILMRYKGSLLSALRDTFPEITWKKEWFEKGKKWKHWNIKDNRILFFENFAKKRNIRELKDWGKVTVIDIRENGGAGLLGRYNDSLFNALKDTFPELQLKREWFPRIPLFERSFWDSDENSRKFLDNIALQYNIHDLKDWRRVSVALIKNKGGRPLLNKFGGMLFEVLKKLYPNFNWNEYLDTPQSISNPHQVLWKFTKRFKVTSATK